MRHLFLIGYRGSGKSTIGRLVAQRLDWQFVDTDDVIEHQASKTISEIFAAEGETGFRDRESQAIEDCAANSTSTVIALGGGAILREANRKIIGSEGKCVWLQGSPEKLHARISGDASSQQRRPNLSDQGGYAEVVEVLRAREPLYSSMAQLSLMTDDATPDELVEEIVDWVTAQHGDVSSG